MIAGPATFVDVPNGYWAQEQIQQLTARVIKTGCDANLYCPERPVTRAEMAVFIDRCAGRLLYPPSERGTH